MHHLQRANTPERHPHALAEQWQGLRRCPPTSKQLTASQELGFCAGVRMHPLEAAQCEHLVALVAMAGTCMADTVTPPLWAPSYASLQSRIIQLLACLCRSAQGDRPADARMLALMPADADSGSVRCLFATLLCHFTSFQ